MSKRDAAAIVALVAAIAARHALPLFWERR